MNKKRYWFHLIEKNKSSFWKNKKIISNWKDLKKSSKHFISIMAPPNITGELHLGHALNFFIQDALLRLKKLKGYDIFCLPGFDHAGIATQLKIFNLIKEKEKINFWEINEEKFKKYIDQWKEENKARIREQWKKLGLLIDYQNEIFTLDQKVKILVKKTFINLYQKGLIYRDYKIVNWDVKLKTAISDIEVYHEEKKTKLYFCKYYFAQNNQSYLNVATTRPETIFVDAALVVNPNDKRYQKYINQKVINPLTKKEIPIISNQYVDINFGTGVMKCTPAHDENDYLISQENNLEIKYCLDIDGSMTKEAGKYYKTDRFLCRKKVIEELKAKDLIYEEDYQTKIAFSRRTKTIIEPYLSKQWFLKTNYLADLFKNLQKNKKEKIIFYPSHFQEKIFQWIKKGNDWCISRQIFWGHAIPAWYHKSKDEVYVSLNPPKNINEWYESKEVLDTWFSSSLWPLIPFIEEKEETIKKFYPPDLLVTAYDIIYFWVARMIFSSLFYWKKKPFKNVIIHGIIRDKNGKKMSKSLNNGINPETIIQKYGVDTLRCYLLTNSNSEYDFSLKEEELKITSNFINKIWNTYLYIESKIKSNVILKIKNLKPTNLFSKWIIDQFNLNLKKWKKILEKNNWMHFYFEFKAFFPHAFCDYYLEWTKIIFNNQNEVEKNWSNILIETKQTLLIIFRNIISILHPLIPFLTEEIYQKLYKKEESILKEKFPEIINIKFEKEDLLAIEIFREVLSIIKKIKKEINFSKEKEIKIFLIDHLFKIKKQLKEINFWLKKIINCEITIKKEIDKERKKNLFNSKIKNENFYYQIDLEAKELNKYWKKEIDFLEKKINKSEMILNNQLFLKNEEVDLFETIIKKKINIKTKSEKKKIEKKAIEKILFLIKERKRLLNLKSKIKFLKENNS
jgi:valyl-tRNA synthetase